MSDKIISDTGDIHIEDEDIDLSSFLPETWVAIALLCLLGITVFYQFFTRYVLNDSAAWTEEIARYLLIVVTFIGSSMAIRRNNHIHVEFIYRWLPAAVARAMSTAVDLVRIAFLAYATWLSIELMPKMANLNMTVVDLSMKWIYGAVTLGFAMMTFRAVQVAIRHKRRGWSLLERPGETED